MNNKEAGRKGGKLIAVRYGREYMRAIGSQGGRNSPTKFVAGDTRTAVIARKGGVVSGGNFAADPERAKEAGRKGGLARARKRAAALADAGKTQERDGA